MPELSAFTVKIGDGLTIATPAQLSSITTYVLLEQENWFEKEIDFVRHFLKPGMTAIDIGANLGVYSLLMARLAGPDGRVFAYEPGGEARAFLEQSRALNGLTNLEILGFALSDGEREGHLAQAPSSELRALGASVSGEPVRVTSLDIEDAARRWPPPDFIKIDAEGEEERIIAGGRAFFSTHSPLVMFEIGDSEAVNLPLLKIFRDMGYRVFRQLAGAPVLVPEDGNLSYAYELNLFAAKPDRAAALSRDSLLVENIADWSSTEDDRQKAVALWKSQGFAALSTAHTPSGASEHSAYADALVGYAVWRDEGQLISTRCAALASALATLRAVCAGACTAARASTWARCALDWGARAEAVTALRRVVEILQDRKLDLTEPFWPACPRFDDIPQGARPEDWFAAAAFEQLERSASFSSCFGSSLGLESLRKLPFASAEMKRRQVLMAVGAGQRPMVPESLFTPAPDNLNANFWRAFGASS